jgi:hypothetical protein
VDITSLLGVPGLARTAAMYNARGITKLYLYGTVLPGGICPVTKWGGRQITYLSHYDWIRVMLRDGMKDTLYHTDGGFVLVCKYSNPAVKPGITFAEFPLLQYIK